MKLTIQTHTYAIISVTFSAGFTRAHVVYFNDTLLGANKIQALTFSMEEFKMYCSIA